MIKNKLFLEVIQSIHSLADRIQAAVEAMEAFEFDQYAPQELLAAEEKSMADIVSLEQVRAVLAEKSQAGFTAEVRGLLEKYGAPRLSQIDPANFAALLADAEALR